jgi:hypothetical protein
MREREYLGGILMNTDVNEWWQEYDRRQHQKAARQILRWLNSPTGESLPADEDVWDDAERMAIVGAWVQEMDAPRQHMRPTSDLLTNAQIELTNWHAANTGEKQRRLQLVRELQAAWKAALDKLP